MRSKDFSRSRMLSEDLTLMELSFSKFHVYPTDLKKLNSFDEKRFQLDDSSNSIKAIEIMSNCLFHFQHSFWRVDTKLNMNWFVRERYFKKANRTPYLNSIDWDLKLIEWKNVAKEYFQEFDQHNVQVQVLNQLEVNWKNQQHRSNEDCTLLIHSN